MKETLYNLIMAQGGTNALTLQTMLLNYCTAAIISALIFVAYKVTHSGPVYSARFNVTLVMLTLITTIIMSVIGNNIALSLGMVGALSIVRFRTAIKDPRDTAYIFWTIAVGICCGVSDYVIAGIGSVFVFGFLILFGFIHNNERVLVIVHGTGAADAEIAKRMQQFFAGKAVLRVHNCSMEECGAVEYIYEVTDKLLQQGEKHYGSLNENLRQVDGVQSVSQVRQDDEINQ